MILLRLIFVSIITVNLYVICLESETTVVAEATIPTAASPSQAKSSQFFPKLEPEWIELVPTDESAYTLDKNIDVYDNLDFATRDSVSEVTPAVTELSESPLVQHGHEPSVLPESFTPTIEFSTVNLSATHNSLLPTSVVGDATFEVEGASAPAEPTETKVVQEVAITTVDDDCVSINETSQDAGNKVVNSRHDTSSAIDSPLTSGDREGEDEALLEV